MFILCPPKLSARPVCSVDDETQVQLSVVDDKTQVQLSVVDDETQVQLSVVDDEAQVQLSVAVRCCFNAKRNCPVFCDFTCREVAVMSPDVTSR